MGGARSAVLLGLFLIAVALAGCGSTGSEPSPPDNPPGGDEPGPPPPAPPYSGPDPRPYLGFRAFIDTGPGVIKYMDLVGSRLELNPEATATVLPAGAAHPVPLSISALAQEPGYCIRQVALQPGLNLLEISAPTGYALTIRTVRSDWEGQADAGTAVEELGVGRLRLAFEMLANGKVIAPVFIDMWVVGHQHGRRLKTWGLAPGDYFRAELHDSSGGMTIAERRADGNQLACVRDPVGGLSDPPLWGPDCLLALYFVRNHDLLPRY